MTDKKKSLTYDSIWKKSPSTPTADKNLDLILGSAINLPLKYWRKNFFFKGGRNSKLKTMTEGKFPVKADPEGTHPVFALKQVANGSGFEVCPCSSSAWKRQKWVAKGTQLLHTGKIMEKTTYLVEQIRFNLPASEAMNLRFMGRVADQDIHSIKRGVDNENR
jgi:hypothetical protein